MVETFAQQWPCRWKLAQNKEPLRPVAG